MWKEGNKAPDLSNSLASSCLLPKFLGYGMAPLYTLRMRSPLLHAAGKPMSLWLRSQLLLCWICWHKGVRACSQERQALQGTAAGNCSSFKLQWSLQQVQHAVPPGSPGAQVGAKRLICHTGLGASKQKEELTKYALLHHDTRTLQILKDKWEQEWFLRSVVSGLSIGWGQLETTDILQNLVSQLWRELWACSCEGAGRR